MFGTIKCARDFNITWAAYSHTKSQIRHFSAPAFLPTSCSCYLPPGYACRIVLPCLEYLQQLLKTLSQSLFQGKRKKNTSNSDLSSVLIFPHVNSLPSAVQIPVVGVVPNPKPHASFFSFCFYLYPLKEIGSGSLLAGGDWCSSCFMSDVTRRWRSLTLKLQTQKLTHQVFQKILRVVGVVAFYLGFKVLGRFQFLCSGKNIFQSCWRCALRSWVVSLSAQLRIPGSHCGRSGHTLTQHNVTIIGWQLGCNA